MKPKKITSYYNILFDAGVGIFLFALIAYIYRGLFNTFFQQDEWVSLGLVIANGPLGILKDYSILELIAGKQRIFGSVINNIFHYFFPFNVSVFFSFSIIFHIVNSFLVYSLIRQFQKPKIYAVIGALFFAVSTVPHQSVTWISAITTVLPNATFVLLSLLFFFKYLNANSLKYLYLSYLLAYISFLFKESSALMFIFIPVAIQVFIRERMLFKNKLKLIMPSILILFSVVAIRAIGLQGPEGEIGVYVTKEGNAFQKLFFHLMSYPVLGFSQLLIPNEIMFKASEFIQHIFYPFLNTHPLRNSIVHILITDLLSLFSAIIVSISIFILWHLRPALRNLMTIFILFTLMTFLPLIVLDRPLSSYLESRYYYLGAIGMAFLISLCFETIYSANILKKSKILSSIVFATLFLSYSGYIYKNIIYTKRSVNVLSEKADERKNFLKLLRQFDEEIPVNPIFLIEGDSPGYYGLSDLAVPFQQGMGYTLMVVYHKTIQIPPDLFNQQFLWNINEQGYKNISGKGFGYFWNRKDLISFFQQDLTLETDHIFALKYSTSTKTLVDITDEISKEIIQNRTL